MKFEIFINKLERLSCDKAERLFEEYKEKIGFRYFAEQQRALDVLMYKVSILKMIPEERMREAALSLKVAINIAGREWYMGAWDNLKGNPMTVWIELMRIIDDGEIEKLLSRFASSMPSMLLETFIINIENPILQRNMIVKYQDRIDLNSGTYENFYYSVDDLGRQKLEQIHPGVIKRDVFLELSNVNVVELLSYIKGRKKIFDEIDINDILDFLLLNVNYPDILVNILDLFSDRLEEIDGNKFEVFILRYIDLRNKERWSMPSLYDEEKEEVFLSNAKLLEKYNKNFHGIGLIRTLSLFGLKTGYYANEFGENIIYEFLDEAYASDKLKPYINNETITNLTNRFVEDSESREYTLDDFVRLVDKLEVLENPKLIHDDYIEAMIACRKLMEQGIINKENPSFIKLREMFIKQTLLTTERDGTLDIDINLNGVFFRLVKGTINFDTFYKIKTYRGLIYLVKCGDLSKNGDTITQFLSDLQVAKIDIRPLIRWKREAEVSEKEESEAFFERMGLQLLLFFGELRAKYLMFAGMKGNKMENLFDGLNYHSIVIDEAGKPQVNMGIMEFLFGKGPLNSTNSIINKMIRNEVPEFVKYFGEFCNNYEKIFEECNRVLSVKRIVKCFENIVLPIELKPDEKPYLVYLKEVSMTDERVLMEAVGLCNDARGRTFSTIPKVKGKLGDFNYEILDYKDPMAVCVGNLSHCCFVVRGISYSALKHSMRSVNGRTFVVYYDGKFLAQSWVWRNGDVVCFDSVEAGSAVHGAFEDTIRVVDVYKTVAREIMSISCSEEDELQRVKCVTVGKSDYAFPDLEEVKGQVARPLENDVYVYDSNVQSILAGSMPKDVRYGVVGARYTDPRGKVIVIKDVKVADLDLFDKGVEKLEAVRYQIKAIEESLENIRTLFVGDDWYIVIDEAGVLDYGYVEGSKDGSNELVEYARRYGIKLEKENNPVYDIPNIKLTKSIDVKNGNGGVK